jgi:hypothetical protein
VKHFSLRRVADSKNLQLMVRDVRSGESAVYEYPPEQQYPLGSSRYYFDIPNIFVDIAVLLDERDDVWTTSPTGALPISEPSAASATSSGRSSAHSIVGVLSLRSLAREAQRAAADGSGNSLRFKDGRDLFAKLEDISQGVASKVVEESADGSDAITDVLKSNNWKKNQPMRFARANPQAWFVTNVFARSNQQKNPIDIYAGTQAVFEAVRAGDAADSALIERINAFEAGQKDNCDLISYGEVAGLVDDSNMLVFLSADALAKWIRGEAKAKNVLHPSTPAHVYIASEQQVSDSDDPMFELSAGKPVTVTHVANILAPK